MPADDPPPVMNDHLSRLFKNYPILKACGEELNSALNLMVAAYRSGKKLLVCGNGGSAADSEHIVAELMKGFLKRRPISTEHATQLEQAGGAAGKHIANRLQGTLAAVSLPSQVSLITAIANDIDFEMIFAQQVYGLGRSGDVLLGISTSGNSKNVSNAVIVAKALGLGTIVLTGRSGGALAPMAGVSIKVPADNTAEIQELHLPVYHWLSTELEEIFFPE
jgi:D-sedoheptulose 7-phosphate isomerase